MGWTGGDATRATATADRAELPIFRALLLVQVAAGVVFGLFPFVLPQTSARLFGYAGTETLVYRIAGAAAAGYAVAAFFAYASPRWASIRIPAVAAFTFNAGAVVAALLSLDEGDRHALVFIVLLAASTFTAITGYLLYRDDGPRGPEDGVIVGGFRLTLIAATVTATVFGVLPLLLVHTFARVFHLAESDLFVYRLAGAATLGYATAGVLQIRWGRWSEIRLQVFAAIAFNALAAGAAARYLASGGRSLLGVLVLVAGAFFAVALTWWSRSRERTRRREVTT